MSSYPFVLQEAMGIPADDPNSGRVANPTSSTPATFGETLNWKYTEGGTSNPIPRDGECTLMGPCTSYIPSEGGDFRDEGAHRVKAALDIMRRGGYRTDLPLDGETEMEYLRENYHEDHKVFANGSDNIAFVVTSICDWIYIRCRSKEASDFVRDHLYESAYFKLALFPHESVSLTIDAAKGVTLTRRTGNGPDSASEVDNPAGPAKIGTLFELKKNGKVVAKALCSYYNGDMNNPGPTIELFEVAKEWRCHGYGVLLLDAFTSYFEDIFANISLNDHAVKFNVCYCTTGHASRWFIRQGFEDWDGMGEELGRYLME